ncbi:hypothetical protein GCM10009555_051380 [Acrocarpospora macrocephala]|uniref:Ferric oxidoreductase domain-containing protein n=1 Tax=Acrocarpospora macrocephala TaxID=150177 RepID=A0A5M3X7P9_9ACTN|nr:hypothetical protein [Acrocarpospora macrocephala]GES16702.1 hypothetical protein Amac_103000 [Acrocarpospora macrocephala]
MSRRRAHRRPETPLNLQSRPVKIALGAVVVVVIFGAMLAARNGMSAGLLAEAQNFLTFYAGVLSLVALTTTVALGLLASERLLLPIPWRVRAQLVHRAAALVGVGFLVTHIGMKIAAGLVPAWGSVLPTTNLAIGAGAIASDMMIVVVATGVMRGRFAQAERPWLWRGLHDLAYLAWPVSILHGLAAGRTPAAWVSWSYIACLVAVGTALLLRVVVSLRPAATIADDLETLPMPEVAPAPQSVPEPISIVGRERTSSKLRRVV